MVRLFAVAVLSTALAVIGPSASRSSAAVTPTPTPEAAPGFPPIDPADAPPGFVGYAGRSFAEGPDSTEDIEDISLATFFVFAFEDEDAAAEFFAEMELEAGDGDADASPRPAPDVGDRATSFSVLDPDAAPTIVLAVLDGAAVHYWIAISLSPGNLAPVDRIAREVIGDDGSAPSSFSSDDIDGLLELLPREENLPADFDLGAESEQIATPSP